MALDHVTTGSSHITTVGVGVVVPTMEGMVVELVTGILTALPTVLGHRIGGISAVMLPPSAVTTYFHCLVNVTGIINHFCSVFDEIS